ncbi:ATP-binding cassette domain-containing protein [Mobilicoccus caccae]|uniref:ABC transporter domain-containing protein n=1 Tax=Mobilicoccus caccae TaxID=1859295 RepID=A0ABQ6IQC5_9MICO|nr:ATP-binding cassette domain-containing protein [Mobilicoccus caccae]GMA40107.1 hypothetical protein GCM10025883_21520 [Mobilicoccus caccae]
MIVLSQFSKRYGRTVVFDDVDVTIDGPGLTLVLGPNGAGKSTLIRCLLSLEPHGGSILWDGAPFRPARREAYPVFDDAPFYPRLTGRQNLRLLAPEAVGRPSPSSTITCCGPG